VINLGPSDACKQPGCKSPAEHTWWPYAGTPVRLCGTHDRRRSDRRRMMQVRRATVIVLTPKRGAA
jgi:hypothetical protein